MLQDSEEVTYIDKEFKSVTYEEKHVIGRYFDNCVFSRSNLKGCVFEKCRFVNCTFEDCDLSLIKLKNTTLNGVDINNCKAIGVMWYEAGNPLTINFKNSWISYSSFFGKNLKKAKFVNCIADEVDFSECNLTHADFREADLTNAIFQNADLTQANFINAKNYSIDIRSNKIKKAKFSLPEALSLLYGLDVIIVE